MKRAISLTAGVLALALAADLGWTQPPGGRGTPRGKQRPGGQSQGSRPGQPGGFGQFAPGGQPDGGQAAPGGEGRPGGQFPGGQFPGGQFPGGPGGGGQGDRPPPNPIVEALDANRDHRITADEIRDAAAALRRLDRNGDGELTPDEFAPQGGPGQEGGPDRGQGGPGGERPGFGPPGGNGPGGQRPGGGERPGPGQGAAGPQGAEGANSAQSFVTRLLQLDRDQDGQLSAAEIPAQLKQAMNQADANRDGKLDRDELLRFAEQFTQGSGGGRPEGGQPQGSPPRRPQRPER